MSKNDIVILEEVCHEVLQIKKEGLLLGSSNFVGDKDERANFIFYYLPGRILKAEIPTELNLIRVTPYDFSNEPDLTKHWAYQFYQKTGIEQYCVRERDELFFYQIKEVEIGFSIEPIIQYRLADEETIKRVSKDYDQFNSEISRLKSIADNCTAPGCNMFLEKFVKLNPDDRLKKIVCTTCGGVKFDSDDENKKLFKLLYNLNLFQTLNTKENLKKSLIIIFAESYISKAIEKDEYFCRCQYKDYEKEEKEAEQLLYEIFGDISKDQTVILYGIENELTRALKD